MQKPLLSLSIALLIAVPAFAQETHTVKRVIAGDTLELSNGERVRLIGVDCPEFKDKDRNKRNADRLGIDPEHYSSYARKAKAYANEMLFQSKLSDLGKVTLMYDDANKESSHRDKYGRLLAHVCIDPPKDLIREAVASNPERYCWGYGMGNDGYLLNALLVADGYCIAYTRFDFKHKERFVQLQEEAKQQGRGMWG